MKKTQSQYQKMNYVFFKLTWFYIFSICLHTFLAFLPEVQRFYSFMITLDISWHCRIFLLPNITLIYNSEYNLLRRLISVCRNCKPANNTPAFSLKENLKRHSLDYRIGLCLENMELSRLDFKKYQTILNFKHQINNVPPKHILSESAKISNKQVDEYGEIAVSHLEQTRREFNENELKEISSLYQSGKTTREIGEIFGVCKTTIVKLLREQGVEVTRSKVQAKLNAEEVISLYGYTSGKIAKQFGVNPQTILKCLRNHGVKIRSRWDYE